MRKVILAIASALCLFPYYAMSDVNFKFQTIKETLAQAKTEQKLIFSVCSSTDCAPCRWMNTNVYSDAGLSATINNKLIPIKPSASMNRLEFNQHCKMLPTMLFLDHNGKTIHKVEGKKTLSEMKMIVEQVLSTSCTGLDEKLDEASGSHQGSVCCEGLVKETMGNERLCVKQYCVENSELGIQFNGDARAALSCCDDSAQRRIISKISGFIVHCVQPTNEMDNTSRVISKRDFIPDVRYKKKKLGSKVISH